MASDEERKDDETIKLLKGYVGILRRAADLEVKQRTRRSTTAVRARTTSGAVDEDVPDSAIGTPRDWMCSVYDVADHLYNLLDTDGGAHAARILLDNGANLLDVIQRFAVTVGPAIPLCSVAAFICDCNRRVHLEHIRKYNDTIEHDDLQIEQLKKQIENILNLIQEASKDIDRLCTISRWVPAEMDRINDLMQDIQVEIELAQELLKLSQDWIAKLGEAVREYESKLTKQNALIWVMTIGVAGILHYAGHISPRLAVFAAVVGSLPLCYTMFSLSTDITRMVAEVEARKRRNAVLELEMKSYALRLQRLKRRHHQAVGAADTYGNAA